MYSSCCTSVGRKPTKFKSDVEMRCLRGHGVQRLAALFFRHVTSCNINLDRLTASLSSSRTRLAFDSRTAGKQLVRYPTASDRSSSELVSRLSSPQLPSPPSRALKSSSPVMPPSPLASSSTSHFPSLALSSSRPLSRIPPSPSTRPPRSPPSTASHASRRSFHSSAGLGASQQNHYAVLNVERGASKKEIKEKFYEVRPTSFPTPFPLSSLAWSISHRVPR
jgi:hypothetical protein